MKYSCEYPNCDFCTNHKNQINNHHIIPKEAGGSNDKWNRILLCGTHHLFIFCPESKNGIHAQKCSNSIILLGWKMTTAGKMLEYIEDGETKYYVRKH